MLNKRQVDVFHVGPQKTATTWVFRCLQEHPEVITSKYDSIHYYTMYNHLGWSWYMKQFIKYSSGKVLFDPTPNYFRSPVAAELIAKDNPDAKIVVCVRHPIERAFSHYWHEKKKLRFNFKFEEALENFDLYTNWIEPGFYTLHLKKFFKYFNKNQILVQFFDKLQDDPKMFLQELLHFIDINAQFEPSVLYLKVNAAVPRISTLPEQQKQKVLKQLKTIGLYKPIKTFKNIVFGNQPENHHIKSMETLNDVDPSFIKKLNILFTPEIDRLEDLFDLDLSQWRNRVYNENGLQYEH